MAAFGGPKALFQCHLSNQKMHPMDDLTVNPDVLPRYDRSREEQEAFLIFSVLAAAKNSAVQAQKLDDFLTTPVRNGLYAFDPEEADSPFEWLYELHKGACLETACKKHGLGKYGLIVPCFRELGRRANGTAEKNDLNPLDTSVEELEELRGVGKKTSRFFLLHTDRQAEVAALDTHILDWLGEQGYNVPNKTPTSQGRYNEIEAHFLAESRRRGLTPANLDIAIWKENSLETTTDSP